MSWGGVAAPCPDPPDPQLKSCSSPPPGAKSGPCSGSVAVKSHPEAFSSAAAESLPRWCLTRAGSRDSFLWGWG